MEKEHLPADSAPSGPNPRLRAWRLLRYWVLQLRHNFPQKLLALLVATLCWYFATEDRRATIQQRYEVSLSVRDNTHSAEKRAVSGLSPERVQVTLSGTRQRLASVNASDIEAYVDVTDQPEGTFSRSIRIDGPDSTRSIKVSPESAQGQIDAQKSHPFAVQVSVLDTPNSPEQISVPIYTASPKQVTATGPSRLVSSVAHVVTVPVALRAGETRSAKVLALDLSGSAVEVALNPSSVMVSRTDSASLPVHRLPVQLSSPPAGLKVTARRIEPPTVRVVGPLPSGLSSVRLQVPYHVGQYSVQPEIPLPAGLHRLDKVTVSLTVE